MKEFSLSQLLNEVNNGSYYLNGANIISFEFNVKFDSSISNYE